MRHRNICCDGCQRTNIPGRRYTCLRCEKYNLCGECYDNGIISCHHAREHPMQLVLDFRYRELYFDGEDFTEMHLPNCYTCPYCGSTGHSAKRFIEHVMIEHRRTEGYVICPMCVVTPDIETVLMRSLWRHLQREHLDVAHQLDPTGPSLRRFSRRTRRRFSSAAAISSFQSSESEPALDMAESTPTVTSEDLDLFEEQRETPAILGPYSSISSEDRAAATECPSTDSIKVTCKNEETIHSVPGSSDTQNFLLPPLLSHLKTDQNASNNLNLQLVKRAYFVEQLLISTIAQDELNLPCELNKQEMQQWRKDKQKVHLSIENTSRESIEATNSILKEEDEEKEKVIVENASEDSSQEDDY